MWSLKVCRVSVVRRRAGNVFCRTNHLCAGFADMMRQLLATLWAIGKKTVNQGTADQVLTLGYSDSNPAVEEKLVIVKPLERCFSEKIEMQLSIIVDTVEDKIQNAILKANDINLSPKLELVIGSINASSRRDATSIMAISVRGKHIGITTPFWKRIRKECYTTTVKYEWWEPKQNSGRSKWIVSHKYAIWSASNHSLQQWHSYPNNSRFTRHRWHSNAFRLNIVYQLC